MERTDRVYLTCPECNTRLRQNRMQGHLRGMHGWSPAQAYRAHKIWLRKQAQAGPAGAERNGITENRGIPVEKLHFELLPPGTWDVDKVIAHYHQECDRFPPDLRNREIQWERLKAIGSLRPTRCYIGTELWLGYVLFDFSDSGKVVLECPVEGNATYILSGEWKGMVAHPKSFLRTNFPQHCAKIVHKGDWISRVAQTLSP